MMQDNPWIARVRWISSWVFVWTLVILLGCRSETGENDAIRLGVVSEVTGINGDRGVSFLEDRVAELNAAGGIAVAGVRRPLRLVFEDSLNTPEGSAQAALRLINMHQVVALIGPSASSNALPVAEIAQQAGVPMITAGSTHPDLTAGRPLVFRIPFTDPVQGQVLAGFASQGLGASRAAAFFDVGSEYSRNVAAEFKASFEALGGSVVSYESFTSVDGDIRPALERLIEARPDVLFLASAEATHQAEQFQQMGGETIFLGSDIWPLEVVANSPAMEGAFASRHWHPDLAESVPRTKEFITIFQHLYGRPPDELECSLDDVLGVLLQAIQDAEAVDAKAIRDALANIEDYPSTTGPLTFRGTDGDPKKPVLMVQVVGGEVVLKQVIEVPTP